jgi:hypothetical protein
MAIRQDKNPHIIDILKTWAILYKPAPVSWDPVTEMIRVAETEAQKLESELKQLLNTSDANLQAISLCDAQNPSMHYERAPPLQKVEAG